MSTVQSALSLPGSRNTGQDVRTQNVMAAASIANIVKSSLGPVGLDKMMVDDVGDVTITNDGATILQLLEVEHPAAKVLVELAALQDEEVRSPEFRKSLLTLFLINISPRSVTEPPALSLSPLSY